MGEHKLMAYLKSRKVSKLLINHFKGGIVFYLEIYKIENDQMYLYLLSTEYSTIDSLKNDFADFIETNNITVESAISAI